MQAGVVTVADVYEDGIPRLDRTSMRSMGRRVMAAAHMLHYGVGIPVRRVPSVLRALTGVELSQSAITQDVAEPGALGRCVP